jgi:hypothetical protein
MGMADAPEAVGILDHDECDEVTGDVLIYGRKNKPAYLNIWPMNDFSEGYLKIDVLDENDTEKLSLLLTAKGVKWLKKVIRLAEKAKEK